MGPLVDPRLGGSISESEVRSLRSDHAQKVLSPFRLSVGWSCLSRLVVSMRVCSFSRRWISLRFVRRRRQGCCPRCWVDLCTPRAVVSVGVRSRVASMVCRTEWTRSSSSSSGPTPPRCSDTPRPMRSIRNDHSRSSTRLTRRGRAEKPTQPSHRPEATRHTRLRPSHTHRHRHPPRPVSNRSGACC